jgi:hypothetical protein
LLIAETLLLKTKKKGDREKRYERIKIRKLREPEKQKEYQEKLDQTLSDQNGIIEDMDLEKQCCEVKKEIIENAEKVCWKAKVKRNAKRTSWWNDTVKTIVEDKKKSWKRFLRAKTREARAQYIEKRNCKKSDQGSKSRLVGAVWK